MTSIQQRQKRPSITPAERKIMDRINKEAMCPYTEAVPLLTQYYEQYEFLPYYLTDAVMNKVRLEKNMKVSATMRRFYPDEFL